MARAAAAPFGQQHTGSLQLDIPEGCPVQCFVFGPAQSGKSSLLRALGRPAEAMLPTGRRSTQAHERNLPEKGPVTAVLPMQIESAQGGKLCCADTVCNMGELPC